MSIFLAFIVKSVQDFLIKLDLKPCMYLVETSIFSLNRFIIRPTKLLRTSVKPVHKYYLYTFTEVLNNFVVSCPTYTKNLEWYLLIKPCTLHQRFTWSKYGLMGIISSLENILRCTCTWNLIRNQTHEVMFKIKNLHRTEYDFRCRVFSP